MGDEADENTESVENINDIASSYSVMSQASNATIREAGNYTSSGDKHTLILNFDGTVSAYGNNAYGQLGTGDNISSDIPVNIAGLSGIIKVVADSNYSIALSSDGKLYSWGINSYGQLGTGNTIRANTPQLINFGTDIKIADVVAKGRHVIALSENGEVYCWGTNLKGQIGKGSTGSYEKSPLKVSGLSSITNIAAGENFSAALSSSGALYTWGDNTYGQLGISDVTLSNLPKAVNISNIKSMAAGKNHMAVVKTDGTVWCFGDNSFSQCGNTIDAAVMQAVQITGLSNITCVESGANYIYAEDTNGNIYVWGSNKSGQLGNSINESESTPQILSETFDSIYIDDYTVYATKGDDKYSWGLMAENNVGDTSNVNTPASIRNYGNIIYVESERDGNITVAKDGSVYSWGSNEDGNLGYYVSRNQTYPKQINGLSNIVKVAKGKYHALALDSNGNVWGWGNNKNGELGLSSYTKYLNPQNLNISNVVDIAAGNNFSVILKDDGRILAYGENINGKLGNDVPYDTSKNAPHMVDGIKNIEEVECGDEFVVVLADGKVYTWGKNDVGQLGIGTNAAQMSSYKEVLENCVDISVGTNHVLALTNSGEVYAWGGGTVGQLGQNNKENSNIPIKVKNLPSNIVSVGAGKGISLAITESGELYAWGYGKDGQLGTGEFKSSLVPKKVPNLSGVKYATAGNSHTVIVMENGTVKTFGDNASGQLGIYLTKPEKVIDIDYDYDTNTGTDKDKERIFNCKANNNYTITISGRNIKNLSSLEFTVTYNPQELKLIDAAAQTYLLTRDYGNVKITYNVSGEIRFMLLKDVSAGYSYNGFINALLFEALKDCNAKLELKY